MTETLRETLRTLDEVGWSVSFDNPAVRQEFQRVETAIERLGDIATRASRSATAG